MKPKKVYILGKPYTIEYKDNPAEVDMHKRESLWGQVDFWGRTIRVYDNENTNEDVWQTIIHEILHAIDSELSLKMFSGTEGHKNLDRIALALADVFMRNGWLKE